jgi:hypothetical protein
MLKDSIAIIISILAVAFSYWQAKEAQQARQEAREDRIADRKESEEAQKLARADSERVQKLQREIAENAAKDAKRSADAAEKSAGALLATTRTFEATSQLSLEPNIEVEARFQSFGKPPTRPRILLWNTGAADTVAISVFLKKWVASSTTGGAPTMTGIGDVTPNWQIPKIAAGAIHLVEVNEQPIEEQWLPCRRPTGSTSTIP